MAFTFSELTMVKPFLEPTKPKDPVRVSFFICQKTPSHCSSGKADATPFLIISLISLKHYLSFKSMASTFPLEQSETLQ
jgi:hypothetical protein